MSHTLHALSRFLARRFDSVIDIFPPFFFFYFFLYVAVGVRRLGFGYGRGWVCFVCFVVWENLLTVLVTRCSDRSEIAPTHGHLPLVHPL